MKTHIQTVFLNIFFSCLLFTGGCSANNIAGNIAVRSHYSSQQCSIDKASVRLINNKNELETLITRSRRTVLSDSSVALPEIDFTKNRALLIALGNKSSAGYNIKLNADRAEIRDQKLMLPVDIISPDKGGFQAQVITSPCVIISFTKGAYTRIIVNEALDNVTF